MIGGLILGGILAIVLFVAFVTALHYMMGVA